MESLVPAQKADVDRPGRGHTWQGCVIVYPPGPIISVPFVPIIAVLLTLLFVPIILEDSDHLLLNTQSIFHKVLTIHAGSHTSVALSYCSAYPVCKERCKLINGSFLAAGTSWKATGP